MDEIINRRSIRSFTDKEIPLEILKYILEAGLYAPSPKNRQPWEYLIISDPYKKNEFSEQMRMEVTKLYDEKQNRHDIFQALDTLVPIRQCSVLVLVCYKNDTVVIHDDNVDWNMHARDVEALELMSIGASVENMMLRAQSLGVSSLWCGDVLYAYKFLRTFSKFPILSAICFGYSDEIPQMPVRKDFDEVFQIL